MRTTLETLLDVRIRALRAAPSPYATVFPADVVSLELVDGTRLSVFVKHFGGEQADHPDKQRRDREIRVYEDLLVEDGLPVPTFLGTRRNEETRRDELYLEHVGGWNLRYHGLDVWLAAASELGRLHVRFAALRDELLRHNALLRLDAARLHADARRALESLRLAYAGLAPRLERTLAGAVPLAAELIAAQGVTLVHNDCSPKNVVADPPRVCFVDWELAAVGCGLIDLVHLRHGLEAAAADDLLAAYAAAVDGTDLLPAEHHRARLVAACELERLLHRLWRSRFWGTPAAAVAEWVVHAEEQAERLA